VSHSILRTCFETIIPPCFLRKSSDGNLVEERVRKSINEVWFVKDMYGSREHTRFHAMKFYSAFQDCKECPYGWIIS
jgi:hypothetical protein